MRTELDYQTFEQPIVRNNAELEFEIIKKRVNDASRRRTTINNPSWINNDVKRYIGRKQRAYEAKKMINSEKPIAEYIETRRQFKRRIVLTLRPCVRLVMPL